MKPLLYLWWHQVKNGVRRAIRSPRRTIGLLFLIGFWLVGPLRFLIFPSERSFIPTTQTLKLPPIERIESVVLVVFIVLCWGQIMSLMNRSVAMSQSDLDVLMPTPIPSRTILGLRMLRDTLMWLILPAVGLLFGARGVGAASALLSQESGPGATFFAYKFLTVGYLLFAGTAVVLSYGVTLRLSRQDPVTARRQLWIARGAGILALVGIAFLAYMVWTYRGDPWKGVDLIANSWAKYVFFPANLATGFVMSPLTGDGWRGAVGFVALLGMLMAAIRFSLNQSGDLYELAASRAAVYGDLMEAAKSGDITRMQQIRAKQGWFKKSRLKWVEKLRWGSMLAPTWREIVLTIRGRSYFMYIFPALFVLIFPIMIAIIDRTSPPAANPERLNALMVPALAGMAGGMFLFILGSKYQADYGIILRRIDLVKPMPMSDRRLIFSELLARILIPAVIFGLSMLLCVPFLPGQAALIVGITVVAVGAIPAVAALSLCTMLLMPDMEDKTQAPLRGIINSLSLFTLVGMVAGLYGVLVAGLRLHPLPSVIPPLGLSFGVSILATLLAARLYRGFDPKD